MTKEWFGYMIIKKIKAMKRNSTHFDSHREKLAGEKLLGRDVEPVLELCTDACHEATLGTPITAFEYRSNFRTCRGLCCEIQVN